MVYKKINKQFLILYCFQIILLIFTNAIYAKDYSFSVPEMKMQVYIQSDSSIKIKYDITFSNNPNAHVIDIVDIGMPTKKYDLQKMSASINGVELTDIRHSTYVKPGVEVHLGNQSISAGSKGTLHFECEIPNMIYQDTTRKDYASFRITPTWFGSQYVTGGGEIWLAIIMLPDIKPEEMLFQNESFLTKVIYEGKSAAIWNWKEPPIKEHIVGISFPKRGLTNMIKITPIDLLFKWFESNENARLIAGLVFIVLFSILFFRFSGGTGCTVYVLLLAAAIFFFIVNSKAHLISFIPLIILLILNERHIKSRKRHYLPPIVSVESGAVKRGLTAPEAAVLLELPLNKVLTLLIFGMLKKGLLEMVKPHPLTVRVADGFNFFGDLTGKRTIERLKAAREKGIVLHEYEEPFLNIISMNPNKPLSEIDFSLPLKSLIEKVVQRMQRFDPAASREYYKYIVSKAVQQAKEIEDIPAREETIDKNLDWILLGDDYSVFNHRNYRYYPRYYRTYHQSSGLDFSKHAPVNFDKTTFKDVASSFAGWTENTMGSLANTISPQSLKLKGNKGIIDLSGVDKVTGDIFEALSSSSGKSGGFGGGCACAGCACACACAGGGR